MAATIIVGRFAGVDALAAVVESSGFCFCGGANDELQRRVSCECRRMAQCGCVFVAGVSRFDEEDATRRSKSRPAPNQ